VKAVIQKISAFYLLFAAIIPFAFILFFQVKQQVVRHQMKECLEHELLQTISIHEKKVHWIKAGKEILVEGKMFDVKSFYEENGLYVFTGLYDHEETALVNQLEENWKKSNESGNPVLTNLFQLLQLVYPNENAYQLTKNNDQSVNYYHLNIQLTTIYKKVSTPPPQS
jgi:hypothetical protein